jgi:hypothetical protein
MRRQVINYARSIGLHIVGYYEAPGRVGGMTLPLSPVCEHVAATIGKMFPTVVMLVVSFRQLLMSLSSLLISDPANSSTAPS